MNLKKYFPDIQYIIAGEGEELDSIKNKIKEYNLQDHVNLVGTVNENQKNYIFSNTDLMIMPTLDESSAKSIEGFGIAYIEAANFKIPSIASNIGGTPEAVIHNKTGLIIKDIDELGFDTIYRERIGETHSILFHKDRYKGFADLRRPDGKATSVH